MALILTRWSNIGARDALLHPIAASLELVCEAGIYDLCSVVVHLGDVPSSGHYIAVVRHFTHDGNWWVYDDLQGDVRRATWHEIFTYCEYEGRPMQSYLQVA